MRTVRSWILAAALVLSPTLLFAQDDAKTIGGRFVEIRVRERNRMQKDYERMQEARAEKLRQAREETAGNRGAGVRGWRTGDYGQTAGPEFEPEPEPVRRTVGVRPIEGTPKYMLYGAVVALAGVIVMRFRQRRAAVTSSKSAR